MRRKYFILSAILVSLSAILASCSEDPPTAASSTEDFPSTRDPSAAVTATGPAARDGWRRFEDSVFRGEIKVGWTEALLSPAAFTGTPIAATSNLPAGVLENSVKSMAALGINEILLVVLDPSGFPQIQALPCLPATKTGADTASLRRAYDSAGLTTSSAGELQAFGQTFEILKTRIVAEVVSYQAVIHQGTCYSMLGLSMRSENPATLDLFRDFAAKFELKPTN